jgi:hypothetical protein
VEYHPRALKVHPEDQTAGRAQEPRRNHAKLSFVCRLGIAGLGQSELPQEAAKLVRGVEREGKTFHTAERAFLKLERGMAVASVFRGRPNFKPSR